MSLLISVYLSQVIPSERTMRRGCIAFTQGESECSLQVIVDKEHYVSNSCMQGLFPVKEILASILYLNQYEGLY